MSNAWAQKNPEAWREYKRQWAAANQEKVKASRKKHRDANKDAMQAKQRAYYAANPEKQRERDRRKTYGLAPAAFQAMLAGQGGACATCQEVLTPGRGTHVDHCHATGRVRGLLCKNCNLALGHVNDTPERLEALAAYLRKHSASLAEGSAA